MQRYGFFKPDCGHWLALLRGLFRASGLNRSRDNLLQHLCKPISSDSSACLEHEQRRDRWLHQMFCAGVRSKTPIDPSDREQAARRTSAAAIIPLTKPDGRRCDDHLDERVETASFGCRRGFSPQQRPVHTHVPERLLRGSSRRGCRVCYFCHA
jgi:hypothetical protein